MQTKITMAEFVIKMESRIVRFRFDKEISIFYLDSNPGRRRR